MNSKPTIPEPPKEPRFPSIELLKEIEREYVSRRPERLRRAPSGFLESEIQAELKALFDRHDVRSKSYPEGDDVIICEGDSWFYHPFLGTPGAIPDQLDITFGYSVLHSNRPGKLLKQSLDEADENFLVPLKDARRREIKALLISGGGNDLINWHKDKAKFSPIFRKLTTQSNNPADYLDSDNHSDNLGSALSEVTGYLDAIAAKLKGVNAGDLPVLLHCYDYIVPGKYGPAPIKNMTITLQLDAIHAPNDAGFRQKITNLLQKRWVSTYEAACKRLGWHFVKTQNIVQGRWFDEIHPTVHGFYSIVATAYWPILWKLGILPSRKVTDRRAA